MTWMYDSYIAEHKQAVQRAYDWMALEIGKELDADALTKTAFNIRNHDQSKWSGEEYGPYDIYFYGGNKSAAVKEAFNRAWLHHIHQNPHHWQHWVLLEDDEPDGYICIEMPLEYVYEMICDWWSFSWRGGNLLEIFDWWHAHEDMKLHGKTRAEVKRILGLIKEKLEVADGSSEV